MSFILKHIRGITYYLNGDKVNTFELVAGKSSSNCVEIGTYDTEHNVINYYPDWRERVQPNLDQFRLSVVTQDRKELKDIIKPQKPKKAPRNSKKSSAAKSSKSV